MMRALVAGAFACAMLTPGGAVQAQSSNDINNSGKCNANAAGSGNTIVINCYTGESPDRGSSADTRHLIVFSSDGFPTVQTWQTSQFGQLIPFNFFPNVVNYDRSEFSLLIGEKTQTFRLSDGFFFDDVRLNEGKHSYKMRLSLFYSNGARVQTQCGGILDLMSSATLIPKMHLGVNPMNGAISPINCNFIAQPSF